MTQEITPPRSIGELLDDSVQLYRRSFRQWWLPSLVVAIGSFVWGYYFNSSIGWGAGGRLLALLRSGAVSWSILPAFLAYLAVSLWAHAAFYIGLNGAHTGSPPTRGELASGALQLVPRFFTTGLLTLVLIVVGFVALVIPGFWVIGRLVVVAPVVAVERLGAFATIQRAWALTRGSYWRVSAVLFVAYVIIAVLGMIVVGLLLVAATVVFRGDLVMINIATLALQALQMFALSSFLPAANVVIYHDLRNRIDGDDLERRAEALARA